MQDELYAHISEDRKSKQLLKEHLYNTAMRAKELGEDVGLGNVCLLIGILHDCGKASNHWQKYLFGKEKSGGDHSSIGAKYICKFLYESLKDKLTKKENYMYNRYNEFLIYPILAHHCLYDILNKEDTIFTYWTGRRLEKAAEVIDEFPELNNFFDEMSLPSLGA